MKLHRVLLGIALSAALVAAETTVAEARKKIAAKKYDEAIAQLETAYKAKPQPDTKKALAEAYLGKADALMAGQNAMPRVKYPAALRSYREVLKYDAGNRKAREGVAQIEGVYKSMGRPVPQ